MIVGRRGQRRHKVHCVASLLRWRCASWRADLAVGAARCYGSRLAHEGSITQARRSQIVCARASIMCSRQSRSHATCESRSHGRQSGYFAAAAARRLPRAPLGLHVGTHLRLHPHGSAPPLLLAAAPSLVPTARAGGRLRELLAAAAASLATSRPRRAVGHRLALEAAAANASSTRK